MKLARRKKPCASATSLHVPCNRLTSSMCSSSTLPRAPMLARRCSSTVHSAALAAAHGISCTSSAPAPEGKCYVLSLVGQLK